MQLSHLTSDVPLSVRFNLTPEELLSLTSLTPPGWLRVEPRKSWTVDEAKEAARAAIIHLVQNALLKRN